MFPGIMNSMLKPLYSTVFLNSSFTDATSIRINTEDGYKKIIVVTKHNYFDEFLLLLGDFCDSLYCLRNSLLILRGMFLALRFDISGWRISYWPFLFGTFSGTSQ